MLHQNWSRGGPLFSPVWSQQRPLEAFSLEYYYIGLDQRCQRPLLVRPFTWIYRLVAKSIWPHQISGVNTRSINEVAGRNSAPLGFSMVISMLLAVPACLRSIFTYLAVPSLFLMHFRGFMQAFISASESGIDQVVDIDRFHMQNSLIGPDDLGGCSLMKSLALFFILGESLQYGIFFTGFGYPFRFKYPPHSFWGYSIHVCQIDGPQMRHGNRQVAHFLHFLPRDLARGIPAPEPLLDGCISFLPFSRWAITASDFLHQLLFSRLLPW